MDSIASPTAETGDAGPVLGSQVVPHDALAGEATTVVTQPPETEAGNSREDNDGNAEEGNDASSVTRSSTPPTPTYLQVLRDPEGEAMVELIFFARQLSIFVHSLPEDSRTTAAAIAAEKLARELHFNRDYVPDSLLAKTKARLALYRAIEIAKAYPVLPWTDEQNQAYAEFHESLVLAYNTPAADPIQT